MSYKQKVFCLGLSRTGTTSLCAALQDLGYTAMHYPLSLYTQSHLLGGDKFTPNLVLSPYKKWRREKEIKALDLINSLEVLKEYDAFGDLPVPLFYRELDKLCPGSKFILTSRDLEKWLISMQWLFSKGKILWSRGLIGDELHYSAYGTTTFHYDLLSNAFIKHIQETEQYFKHRDNDFCHLKIDKGELTYDTLKQFLSIDSDLSGPCPKVNDAKAVSLPEYASYAWNKSPLSILSRKLSSLMVNR